MKAGPGAGRLIFGGGTGIGAGMWSGEVTREEDIVRCCIVRGRGR
jgi:hypothetical protein